MKIFELDNIYNVDCYKNIQYIPDKSIDLIIIDPPYLLKYLNGGGIIKEKRFKENFKQLERLRNGIDLNILPELIRIMKKINIYIWCNKAQIYEYLDFFLKNHKCSFDLITWHKTNAPPLCGCNYLVDTEYCLYFRESRKLNTSYQRSKTHYELQINIIDKRKYKHPTIKPYKIIENFILNSSNENDVVFDCFLGSGTTAVAAKGNNRKYLGFEIEKSYFDIALDRLNNLDQIEKKEKTDGIQTIFDFI